jgi:ABC-2 type transport system permease protein
MPANKDLTPVYSRGWRGGLGNMLRGELDRWFGTRTWWTQALMWTLIIDGFALAILLQDDTTGTPDIATLFVLFAGMFPSIAVVIRAQDAIVGEKEKGTAAWVLSKPVSRIAFVLSKAIAYALGILVSLVLIPSMIAFLEVQVFGKGGLEPGRFALGMAMLWVYQCFYLMFTLMLGTFFSARPAVIGIPLALAFGQQLLFSLLPSAVKVLPWTIAIPFGTSEYSIISAIMIGRTPGDMTPFYVACVAIAVFLGLGLWRFEREEL